jgi:hypothetical protein
VDSRTSDVSIFLCSGSIHWILIMFDVMTHLLCWIVMCILHFILLCMCCIFYMLSFRGSPAGEADKIGKKNLKKFLCSSVIFISSPVYIIYVPWLTEEHKFGYVPRLTDERKFIYVPRFWAEERKFIYVPRFRLRNVNSHMFLGFGSRNVSSDIFLGWPSNISSYIPRCHVTEEYSYVPWSRCPCSLIFVKIYSSIPRNINYVSRPLTYVPRFLPDEYLPISCSDQLSHH